LSKKPKKSALKTNGAVKMTPRRMNMAAASSTDDDSDEENLNPNAASGDTDSMQGSDDQSLVARVQRNDSLARFLRERPSISLALSAHQYHDQFE
jgi:hypothetical protein